MLLKNYCLTFCFIDLKFQFHGVSNISTSATSCFDTRGCYFSADEKKNQYLDTVWWETEFFLKCIFSETQG